ncbi:hypothetical protein DERP_007580 [Dermatophagoides pteronyssinus]|uniref:Uncharacterized protein n=1 Tax=Dermatophagoides pteronyssinus TaxID=6956 RepID=A0ABQ8JK48_DERPT|nr:hypothetical protein DERP_007580 [Dermatophagoides pteronyssinus]
MSSFSFKNNDNVPFTLTIMSEKKISKTKVSTKIHDCNHVLSMDYTISLCLAADINAKKN